MVPLAKRILETPVSATVHMADMAAKLRREGVDVLDFSAGRAAEHSPDYVNLAAAEAVTAGDTYRLIDMGGTTINCMGDLVGTVIVFRSEAMRRNHKNVGIE
jgi:hypothetical protein